MYFRPTGAEIPAPTTLVTSVKIGGTTRAINNLASAQSLYVADKLDTSTIAVNASLQADIELINATYVRVGATAVHAQIPAATTVLSVLGNVVTLSANLTGAIDGSTTPESIIFYDDVGDMTLAAGEVVIIDSKDVTLYADAATVLLTSITSPKG